MTTELNFERILANETEMWRCFNWLCQVKGFCPSYSFEKQGADESPRWQCMLKINHKDIKSIWCSTKRQAKDDAVKFYLKQLINTQCSDITEYIVNALVLSHKRARRLRTLNPQNDTVESSNMVKDSQLVKGKYGLHFPSCPWSNDNCTTGPDTCACVRFLVMRRAKGLRTLVPENETSTDSTEQTVAKTVDSAGVTTLESQRDSSDGQADLSSIILPGKFASQSHPSTQIPLLLNRWNFLKRIEWKMADTQFSIINSINIINDIVASLKASKNPSLVPLMSHVFIRPEVTLRFLLNSTRFQQGLLIIAVRYGSIFDSSSEGVDPVDDARLLVQMDHVLINAQTSNVGLLKIPYNHFLDMLSLQGLENASQMYYATVYIGVLSPLLTADGNSQTADLNVYSTLSCDGKQTQLFAQCPYNTPPEVRLLSPQGNTISAGIADHIGYHGPTPDAWKDTWNTITDIGKKLPIVGPIADVVTGGANAVSNIVDDIAGNPGDLPVDFGKGGSSNNKGKKPKVKAAAMRALDVVPVANWSGPALAQTTESSEFRNLGTSLNHCAPKSILSVPSRSEYSFAQLKSIWGFVDHFTFNTQSTIGVPLYRIRNSPILGFEVGRETGYRNMILCPFSYLSQFFQYFTGDIEIKLTAVKTNFHSFRLGVYFIPAYGLDETQLDAYAHQILDFQENGEQTFTIPNAAFSKVAPLWKDARAENNSAPTPFCYGYVAIAPVTNLIDMESVYPSVDILVYARAAPNYSAFIQRPSATLQHKITKTGRRLEHVRTLRPENEEKTIAEQQTTVVPISAGLAGSIQFDQHEDIIDLTTRFVKVYTQNWYIAQIKDNTNSDGEWTSTEVSYRPARFNFDVNAGSIYARIENWTTPAYAALHDGFRFFRGSKRYQLVVTSSSDMTVEVYHVPFVQDAVLQPGFYDEDQFNTTLDHTGNQLARELAQANTQTVIPFTVPWVNPNNFIVNGYDPTINGYMGHSAYSNGQITVRFFNKLSGMTSTYTGTKLTNREVIDIKEKNGFMVQLYESLTPDSQMYCFQGFPSRKVGTADGDYIDMNQVATSLRTLEPQNDIIESFDDYTIAKALTQDFKEAFNACSPSELIRVVSSMRKDALNVDGVKAAIELYSKFYEWGAYEACGMLKPDVISYVFSREVKKHMRMQRAQRRRKARQLSPQNDIMNRMKVITKKYSKTAAVAAAAAVVGGPAAITPALMACNAPEMDATIQNVAEVSENLKQTVTNVNDITGKVNGFLDQARGTVGAISESVCDRIAGAIGGAFTKLANFNPVSFISHIVCLFKSSEVSVRWWSFVGVLADIGIVTVSSLTKIYGFVRDYFIGSETKENVVGLHNLVPENDIKDNEANNDKLVLWFKLLLGGVVGMLGFATGYHNSYAAAMKNVFKDGMWMLNQVDLFLRYNLEIVREFIYWCVGKENPSLASAEILKSKDKDIREWAELALELTSGRKQEEVMNDHQLQLKVVKAWEKSCELVVNAKKLPTEYSHIVTHIHRKLTALYDRVAQRVGMSLTYEPLSLWFSGPPGVGKSSIIEEFSIKVAEHIGVVYASNPIYVRNANVEFWNGYHGQPIVIIDDFLTVKEPSVVKALLADWYSINSCAEFNPAFAALEDKDRIANPKILCVNSNFAFPKSNLIADTQAFYRRRDYLIHVRLAPWVREKHPKLVDMNYDFFDEEDRKRIAKYEHLEFALAPNAVDEKWKPPADEWCPYEMILAQVCETAKEKDEARRERAKRAKELKARLHPDTWMKKAIEADDEDLKEMIAKKIEEKEAGLGAYIKSLLPTALQPENPNTQLTYKDKWPVMHGLEDPHITCACFGPDYTEEGDIAEYGCVHTAIPMDSSYCGRHEAFIAQNKDDGEEFCVRFRPCKNKDCIINTPTKATSWYLKWKSANTELYPNVSLEGLPSYCLSGDTWTKKASDLANKLIEGCKSVVKTIWDNIGPIIRYCLLAIGAGLALYELYQLVYGEPTKVVVNGEDRTDFYHTVRKVRLGMNTAALATTALRMMGPQLATSGDVKTAAAKAGKVMIRAIKPQNQNISKAVIRNTVFAFIDVKKKDKISTTQARGLALCDRYAIFTAHTFMGFDEDDVTGYRVVINSTKGPVGLATLHPDDLDVQQLADEQGRLIDLVLVKFPKKVPCFRDIRHLIANAKDHSAVGQTARLFEVSGDSLNVFNTHELKIRRHQELVKYSAERLGGNDDHVLYLHGYNYAKCGNGMCGSLLYDEKHGKIIGFHVAGEMEGSSGYAQLLDRTYFDDLIAPNVLDVEETLDNGDDPVVQPSGDFVPLAKLPQNDVVRQPAKTAIRESLAKGVLGEPARYPVQIRVEGECVPGVTNLEKAVEKQTVPTRSFPQEVKSAAFKDLTETVLTTCRPVREVKQKRDYQEAVFGVPETPFMFGLKMSTSPGWPLTAKFKGKDKRFFVDSTLEPSGYRLNGLHPDLVALYEREHGLRVKGVIPECVYQDFLKDERLKPGKAPRLINGCSFSETIEWRRYCMDFFAAYQAAGLDINVGIGMNVRGHDWSDMIRRLTAVSPDILTLDYKNFGPTLDSELVTWLSDLVNDWYDKYCGVDEEANLVRRVLFEGLAHSRHVAYDAIYQLFCGSPSGNPYTAPINSLVNSLYIRIAWRLIFKDDPAMLPWCVFHRCLYFVVYGDDFIGAIDPRVSDRFNNFTVMEALAPYGIIITDAVKDGAMRKYCTIEDATFLKGTPVPHPTRRGLYLFGLDKSVLEDIPNWIRSPCPDEEEQILQNCRDALSFAHGWGPSYFECVRRKLQSWWDERGRVTGFPTWKEVDAICFDGKPTEWLDSDLFRLLGSLERM